MKDLENLIEVKRKNNALSELMRDRDRLRLKMKRIEDSIETLERLSLKEAESRQERESFGSDMDEDRRFSTQPFLQFFRSWEEDDRAVLLPVLSLTTGQG